MRVCFRPALSRLNRELVDALVRCLGDGHQFDRCSQMRLCANTQNTSGGRVGYASCDLATQFGRKTHLKKSYLCVIAHIRFSCCFLKLEASRKD
jgi:hypothetical protein